VRLPPMKWSEIVEGLRNTGVQRVRFPTCICRVRHVCYVSRSSLLCLITLVCGEEYKVSSSSLSEVLLLSTLCSQTQSVFFI
jgi:hypothetical protein